jgi:hypothetical protein
VKHIRRDPKQTDTLLFRSEKFEFKHLIIKYYSIFTAGNLAMNIAITAGKITTIPFLTLNVTS